MTELTDDELTVLLIAKEGQSMMPIGRWAAPVRALASRGLLHKNNDVNYGITDAGRVAVEKHDTEDATALLEVSIKTRNAHEQYRQSVEQAALHLSFAVKAAAEATGDTGEIAVRKSAEQAIKRAMELLRG